MSRHRYGHMDQTRVRHLCEIAILSCAFGFLKFHSFGGSRISSNFDSKPPSNLFELSEGLQILQELYAINGCQIYGVRSISHKPTHLFTLFIINGHHSYFFNSVSVCLFYLTLIILDFCSTIFQCQRSLSFSSAPGFLAFCSLFPLVHCTRQSSYSYAQILAESDSTKLAFFEQQNWWLNEQKDATSGIRAAETLWFFSTIGGGISTRTIWLIWSTNSNINRTVF